MAILLEICVDSPEGLIAAVKGGADRVELCAALALGGLSPTSVMMAGAGLAEVPAVVMIRPRAGDFVWTAEEMDHMLAEIDEAQEMGMDGIAIGANRPDGALDDAVLRRLLRDVDGRMDKVLHRAVDLTPDPVAAVDAAVALGFDRILTSGGAVRAADGIDRLQAMQDRAQGRITIMPGAGITAENAGALLAQLPVTEVHASCAADLPQAERVVAMGFAPAMRRDTDAGRVAALRAVLDTCG